MKHTGANYDIRVETDKGWVRVECKFTLTHVYHSWFMRDWYSRSCDIIVTNDKWNVRYEDRKLLRKTGRKLMSTREFMNYVLKLCKKGNKYIVFEYPNTVTKSRKTDLSSVKLSPLAKTGGVLMAKDEDSYDKFTWYCDQCCRYEKNCKIIEEHEWNRLRFYEYLQRPKHRQTILFKSKTEEKDLAEFMKLKDEFLRSLDVVLKCLRKKNYQHRLYLKDKTEYPCFYEHQEFS